MVCSSCGFENAGKMRFCGMCGTPLPHAPLTAPGAHSTLNFTRVPVEVNAATHARSSTPASPSHVPTPPPRSPVAGAPTSSPTATASATVEEPADAVDSRAAVPMDDSLAAAAEPPMQELVPDVPFDEYVQNFHYKPPSDPTEITMHGDAPATEQLLAADKAPAADSIATDAARPDATAVTAPTKSDVISAVASDSSVESRLGLDRESPAVANADRPRFLDIGEAPAETEPASSGTSTIVGPSFLGLSDAPQVEADYGPVQNEEAPPRKSHWRAWLAAAIVVIFGGLGWMEWRAQSNQTNNGPVEVIKAKLRNWKNGGQSQATDQAAADASAKPDMQVQEQLKSQQQDRAGNATQEQNPGSRPAPASSAGQPNAASVTPAAPANSQPQPTQSANPATQRATAPGAQNAPTPATKPGQTASAASPSKPPTTTQALVTKPQLAREDQASDDDTAAAKPGAGADELNKAKNASDSAAEAAWLWKSTAKGNPDAPVLLADMYMKGDGVPRSCEQAVVLLKTAAEKENARARNRLASMYATGNCVQRNRVEAYRWLSSALVANPHSDWAQQNKDLIWRQMTPEEQAQAQKYR